jgi:hypothetical protein
MNLMPWDDPREIERAVEKHRRDLLAYEQQMRDISERQDRLLLRIEEEEARIDDRRRLSGRLLRPAGAWARRRTGSRPCLARAGSPTSASTAQRKHSLTRPGGQTTSLR